MSSKRDKASRFQMEVLRPAEKGRTRMADQLKEMRLKEAAQRRPQESAKQVRAQLRTQQKRG